MTTHSDTTHADPGLHAAHLARARWRAECELLAATADSPRRSFALLREMGVTDADIANPDAYAVYIALQAAGEPEGPPHGKDRIGQCVVRLLQSIGQWNPEDGRQWVGAWRWGPASLVAVLTRIAYDPDLIRSAVARLREIDRQQAALLRQEAIAC